MKETMTIREFVEFAESQTLDAKKVFGVTFVKKDGTLRTMACRRGVSKGVKGVLPKGHRKAEDRRCGVLTVFDMNKVTEDGDTRGAFRRINLAGIQTMSLLGNTFVWDASRELLVRQ